MVRCFYSSTANAIASRRRGGQATRRFFTRWHEIALLLVEPKCERQVVRSTNDPLERFMDQIAGHVGFYETLFTPTLKQHLPGDGLLTFEIIDEVRQSFCSNASFQSTLFACQRRLSTPVLYIEARMAYSESERRELNQMRMFNFDKSEMQLRVQLSVTNAAARLMKLSARWNMEVPESSIIYSASSGELPESTGEENLKAWTFSKGGYLTDGNVFA